MNVPDLRLLTVKSYSMRTVPLARTEPVPYHTFSDKNDLSDPRRKQLFRHKSCGGEDARVRQTTVVRTGPAIPGIPITAARRCGASQAIRADVRTRWTARN